MSRSRLTVALLCSLLAVGGLVLASGDSGPYSEAVFEVSDDAAVMVLRVDHAGRSIRLYGDGRLELRDGSESYTRRVTRSRLLALVRSSVDHGLAEMDPQVVILKTRTAEHPMGKPCTTERVTATLRFTAYDRHGVSGGVERVGICPDDYPQIVQSRALAELRDVLEAELQAAKREGSIELPAPSYRDATFQLSSDPEQLILSFKIHHGYNGLRSLSLYGDGRLELRVQGKKGRDLVIWESFDRQLDYPEMAELVRQAVDHGFAEWDADSLHFQGVTAYSTHALWAFGEIHLESYQRGDYSRLSLVRPFKLGDVRLAREFSADVLQVQGLEAMVRSLDHHFESARREAGE